MNYFERKERIIELIKNSGGSCNTNYMCKKLFASRSTIRRDLIALEEEGIIQRQHGSIRLMIESASETSATMRKMINQDKKNLIAKLARDYIKDNMVIFLDSSSTVSTLAPILTQFKNLTVITNGLNIAGHLANASSIKCYICPGVIKNKSMSIIGEYASRFLENFRADLVFFSTKALHPDGLFEGDDSQALCKRRMIENANKKILLCDNTKEYSSAYFKLCTYADVDILISNDMLSEALSASIRGQNCEIVIPVNHGASF